MKYHSDQPLCRPVFRLLLGVAAAIAFSSCNTMLERTDPEYDRQIAFVSDQCKGDEIVGVWVTKSTLTRGGYSMKEVLLFRPDGSAQARVMGADPGPISWRYEGAGVWSMYLAGRPGVTSSDSHATVRYVNPTANASARVLADMRWQTVFGEVTHREVYVNPDDEAAVTAVLMKR